MKTIKKITLIVMLLLLASLFCVFVGCDRNVGRGEGNGDNTYESFCVTFELGDETFKSYSSTATGKVERPNDPQRDGYTFLDWYESQEFEQVFNFDCVIDKDTTIYALWEKNPNKIRFEGNGSNLGIMSDIIVESNSPVKLPLNTFVRDGYEFIGWSDIPNGSVKNKDGGWFYMEDGVVTLFACWQPKQYLVLLDNDYGEESNSQIVAMYG
ncbi:MAG: InlB B-repeat-containing protein, partial [Clostridia bacterium]|nr:InlB B-repeat-containing protein [Clostridia bacterium]